MNSSGAADAVLRVARPEEAVGDEEVDRELQAEGVHRRRAGVDHADAADRAADRVVIAEAARAHRVALLLLGLAHVDAFALGRSFGLGGAFAFRRGFALRGRFAFGGGFAFAFRRGFTLGARFAFAAELGVELGLEFAAAFAFSGALFGRALLFCASLVFGELVLEFALELVLEALRQGVRGRRHTQAGEEEG